MKKRDLITVLVLAAMSAMCSMPVFAGELANGSYSLKQREKSVNVYVDKISSAKNYTAIKHYITEDRKKGLLVMPTGSGKSRTAITFLVKEMVSAGYQILWIAHRHMLINQAADNFYRFAGLAKIKNSQIRNYRISCISGQHMNIKSVDKHEIIVASISSICRNQNHLKRILGNKVMIVVDEAHHTLAPTYRTTIHMIQKCRKNTKLLGLTATPVRGNDKESKGLFAEYDNCIVHSELLSNLIANGILAEPKFKRILTGKNFEPEITIDEEKLLRKYGELPESLINKIALSNARNQMILDEYLKHRNEYGKTLIFAMNVMHCRLLYEELSKANIKCGLVYSGKEDNSRIINNFKSGKIDVLVNVNIMAEGTDVPDIQTVFLTRPTSREGLLMQMIGRGMRGKRANGTEYVNVIDFHDEWDIFNKWLNPEWLMDEEKDSDSEKTVCKKHKKTDYITYEWKLCQDIYKAMQFKCAEYNGLLSLPVGWYTLIDEEGELVKMLIFEDQLQGIKQMMSEKKIWSKDINITPLDLIAKYFGGFCSRLSEREIALLMDNVRTLEEQPQIHAFENRKRIDPYYVVKKAEKERLDLFEQGSDLFDENDLVKDLYLSKEKYIMELCKTKLYKDKSYILGTKVEELQEELNPFDRTPYYDLDELVQEVKDMMFNGNFEGISSIQWTDRAYRTYYGIHYGLDHSIKINSVLNSKDVPREVVKFVIYHELLHRDNMHHFDIVEW